jgi:hypothetical protein
MNMKKLFCSLGLPALLALASPPVRASDAAGLDGDGYIRDWLMLAPIALPEGTDAGDLLLRPQVPDEAKLQPKAGDMVTVNGRQLTWQPVTAPTNYFDLNATLKAQHDQSAGFMVTYVECDREIPDVIISVGSNDQGRIYFNGVDIYAFTEARPLTLDDDKGRITLRPGINVLVFKVINQQNAWQGAIRLTDRSGRPLKEAKIRLSP